MRPAATMLISSVHDQTYWRAAQRARLQFRSARRQRRRRPPPQRGHRHRRQQSRRRAGNRRSRARESTRKCFRRKGSSARRTIVRSSRCATSTRWIWFVSPATCVCFRRFRRGIPQYILNIHPSLLPSFPGLESQKQALEYGAKFAGCTVHFVDENLDAGPIIVQSVVPVEDHDTPNLRSRHTFCARNIAFTPRPLNWCSQVATKSPGAA